MYLILSWVITAVALLVVARVVKGIEVDSFGTALIAAIIIGLINAILGPILLFLTLPINFLTLGLFTFVVNGLLLKLAATVMPGFRINGCLPAILGAVLMTLIRWGLNWLIRF